jgi:ATP-dependent DNA helicase HFM1/MER3
MACADSVLPIRRLPERYKNAFSGPTLTRIQSRSYELAFESDENSLVAAPSGCDKTGVAELAFLRAISTASAPLLIIYVSPLRPACRQKAREWRSRFEPCGLSVQDSTDDDTVSFPFSIKEHTLLCMTPDQCDIATRSWNRRFQISLVIADELQTLGDPRGAVLEALLSRFLFLGDRDGRRIRIMGLSALCPNCLDIAQWLRVPLENAGKTVFGNDCRPVKLSTHVFGYTTAASNWLFESSLTRSLSSVIAAYSDNKSVLVFCCSRRSCEATALKLTRDFPSRPIGDSGIMAVSDKGLALCLKGGVGFCTAGLCPSDQTMVQQLFETGAIRILCATLAEGIGAQAKLVIVKGTSHCPENALQDYSSTEILHMVGQAGRPHFHEEGTCVIMTEAPEVTKYENVIKCAKPIESSLMENLGEHLNAEIALGFISNITDVFRWLRSTYLYIRVRENFPYYHVMDSRAIDNFLQDLCRKHLNQLESQKMILIGSHGDVEPLPSGSICSKYGVLIKTVVTFLEADLPMTLWSTLLVISLAAEFQENGFHPEERQRLRAMSVDPVLRFADHIKNDADFHSPAAKVRILLDSALAHGHIDDWNFAQEFQRIKRIAGRLLGSLFELMVQKKSFTGAANALLLQKCIAWQMWDDNAARLFKQIRGIDEVYAQKIHDAGCKTFGDLRRLQPNQIDRITGHRVGWGMPIHEQLGRVPDYLVTLSNDDEIRIVVRNLGEKDPSSLGHKANILVGIEQCDLLISHFQIKHVVAQMNRTFHVQIPDGFTFHDISVRLIDEQFIGIDTNSRASKCGQPQSFLSSPDSPTQLTSPRSTSGGASRTRITAAHSPFLVENDGEEEDAIVWEMKRPPEMDDVSLDPDFWNHLKRTRGRDKS